MGRKFIFLGNIGYYVEFLFSESNRTQRSSGHKRFNPSMMQQDTLIKYV